MSVYYKCDKCGRITDSLPTIIDKVPYGDTTADLESIDDECKCGGLMLEATKCRVCGEIKNYDDGVSFDYEICHDCLDKISDDLRTVREAYENTKEGEVDSLAEFIVEYGLGETISKIVWDYIETEYKFSWIAEKVRERIKEYINNEKDDFAERLVERGIIE